MTALKMDAVRSSETFASFFKPTNAHTSEDQHRRPSFALGLFNDVLPTACVKLSNGGSILSRKEALAVRQL
jgi:hypothetical protein